MTYKDAEQYIYSLIPRETIRGGNVPARMALLLEKLNNPQKDVLIVHVAGTSGKGSTVALLSSILSKAGYITGSYTSPHVVDLRERIKINKAPINKSQFSKLVEQVALVVETLNEVEIFPTYFEVLFAISLLHFRDQNVDVTIIETGVGGKNDATSVITPIMSIITSVGLDHTDRLGDTLSQIAHHKAGIIKPGVAVVSGVKAFKPQLVINSKAKECASVIKTLGDDFYYELLPLVVDKTAFTFRSKDWQSQYETSLRGSFQAHNATLAIQAALLLREEGFGKISDSAIRLGLLAATIPGRMEFINTTPFTILDVAHSVPKIEALVASYQQIRMGPATVIFACGHKTDYKALLERLSTIANHIIITEFESHNGPRIARPISSYDCWVDARFACIEYIKDPHKAIKKATSYGDPILITGSVFFISAVRPFFF